MTWPTSLRRLYIGAGRRRINQEARPAPLQMRTSGTFPNQLFDGGGWRPLPCKFWFPPSFNEAIEEYVWPAGIQEITFGTSFNRSIDKVAWPSSLRRLMFGFHFFFFRPVYRKHTVAGYNRTFDVWRHVRSTYRSCRVASFVETVEVRSVVQPTNPSSCVARFSTR